MSDGSSTLSINVVVRKRPMSDREDKKNDIDIVEKKSHTNIVVKERKEKVDLTQYIEEHMFSFDQVFDDDVTNEQLYLDAVQPLVAATFEGSMTTVFAYGQTGSGKTHTMMGNPKRDISGMYLLAARDIFHLLDQEDFQGIILYVSFYEIY